MATRSRTPNQPRTPIGETPSTLGGATGVRAAEEDLDLDAEAEDLGTLGEDVDDLMMENSFDSGAMASILNDPNNAGAKGLSWQDVGKYLPAGISTLGSLAYMDEMSKTPGYIKRAQRRYDDLSEGGTEALAKDPSYLAALGTAQRQSAAGGWSGSNTEMQSLMGAAGQSYDRALQRYADVGFNSPTAQMYSPAVVAQQRMAALGNIAGDVGDVVALSGGSNLTEEQKRQLQRRTAQWRPDALAAMGGR